MGKHLKGLAKSLSHTGLWCVEVWLYYVVSFVSMPYDLPWQVPYLVCMVGALITSCFGLLFGKRVALLEKCQPALDIVDRMIVALACAGTFTLGAPAVACSISPVIAVLGLAFAGYHAGSQFVRWTVLYSTADTQNIASLIITQTIISSLVATVLFLAPPALSLSIACLLPVGSSVFLGISERTWPEFDLRPSIFSARQLAGMWRVWIVLLGTTLIMGVVGNASISCFSMPPRALLLLQKTTLILLGLCLLAWMARTRSFIGFAHLWRLTMVTIGVLLVVVARDTSNFVFELLTTTLHSIMHVFFLVTICDMVGRTKLASLNSHIFVSLLLGAYFGTLVIASPISDALGFSSLEESVPYLFFFLVVIAASSWGANDFAMRAMFEGAGRDPSIIDSHKAIELPELCSQAADRYGLTRREAEILGMLLMDRTRTYIAETLFISENTVKTHISSIYAKMGVHSKKELRSLMGVSYAG